MVALDIRIRKLDIKANCRYLDWYIFFRQPQSENILTNKRVVNIEEHYNVYHFTLILSCRLCVDLTFRLTCLALILSNLLLTLCYLILTQFNFLLTFYPNLPYLILSHFMLTYLILSLFISSYFVLTHLINLSYLFLYFLICSPLLSFWLILTYLILCWQILSVSSLSSHMFLFIVL